MTLKDAQWVLITSSFSSQLGSSTSRCLNRSAEKRLFSQIQSPPVGVPSVVTRCGLAWVEVSTVWFRALTSKSVFCICSEPVFLSLSFSLTLRMAAWCSRSLSHLNTPNVVHSSEYILLRWLCLFQALLSVEGMCTSSWQNGFWVFFVFATWYNMKHPPSKSNSM